MDIFSNFRWFFLIQKMLFAQCPPPQKFFLSRFVLQWIELLSGITNQASESFYYRYFSNTTTFKDFFQSGSFVFLSS